MKVEKATDILSNKETQIFHPIPKNNLVYELYIQVDVSGFFLIFHINKLHRHLISLSAYTCLDQVHWQQKM